MKHKFIPISKPSITSLEIDNVTKAVTSGWVSSLGEYVDQFERDFSEFCKVDYCLSTSNGTTALHLALLALGVGPGDEVIVPDLTFIATANAVKYTGATVVLVDIDSKTLTIDAGEIRKAITKKTKVIIPVHLYGHPAYMPDIMIIANEFGLHVIEDCAEAHGARINGKIVGSWGDINIFSFYGNKIITTGEGGAVVTNNSKLYERMKLLRDHAMSKEKRYWHIEVGYNYRMTNIQAALGVAQLQRIDEILENKKKIFEKYKKELSGLEGLCINRKMDWADPVYWMICIEIDGFDENIRNHFIALLNKKNIDSRPYFYPISDMPMYPNTDTIVTHELYKKGINLPSYIGLSDLDIEYICNTIKSVMKE
jgi:perosamine synthetase